MDEKIFYSYNTWKIGPYRIADGIIERDIHKQALRFLQEKEIFTLLGLRQTGKSTLVFQLIYDLLYKKEISPDRIFYFTFDDLSLRNELQSASFSNFITIIEKILGEEIQKRGSLIYIFIDEAQKLPGFIEYIKSLYDLKLSIKWILTGSSSLELRGQIKESLAGRVLNLTILPFSEREILKGYGYHAPDKKDLWDFIFKDGYIGKNELKKFQARLLPHKARLQKFFEEYLIYGSLPEVALSKNIERKQILLENYRDTYLEQDIRNLVKEDKLWVYQRVMELLASRIGDLLNYANIASQLEVTVDTVKRYTMLLEKTFILKNVTTYSRNIRSEILKTPKVYFSDLGLRNSLLRLNDVSQMKNLGQYGLVLENAIIRRLDAAISCCQRYKARLHFWRTKNKEEVDIVVCTPERLLPIEVKSDKKVQAKYLRGIRSFLKKEKEKVGILVSGTDEVDVLEDKETSIYIFPFWMF